MHPCEPGLQKLKFMRREMKKSAGNEEVQKKLHALDVQITRRTKEEAINTSEEEGL